jgi:hypothetical protein
MAIRRRDKNFSIFNELSVLGSEGGQRGNFAKHFRQNAWRALGLMQNDEDGGGEICWEGVENLLKNRNRAC